MTATSGYPVVRLMDHVKELSSRNRNGEDLPVYSVTNTEGFLPSGDYFKKQVFSKDTSNYKIVPPDAFAYNPSRINVGSIDFLRHDSSVLVSPLYIVFQTSTALYPAYLKRFLLAESGMNQINHHTQGAVRDSLKFSGLQKIEIPLPPLDEQKRIAAVLDMADALRRQRQESLQLTEKLLQSVFVDMFGDPMTNPKGLPLLELGRFGIVQTGNTPPRSNKSNYSDTGLEWIKTDNIVEDQVVVTPAREKLSASGAKIARVAPAGSLLVACIAGSEKSIGRAALTDRKVAFNQQINSITPHADTSPLYLYFLVKIARQKIQMAAGKGMKKMINKSTFEGLRFIAPEYDDQLRFERVAQRLIEQSEDCQKQLIHLERFFSALQQSAFRGELDLTRLVFDEETGQAILEYDVRVKSRKTADDYHREKKRQNADSEREQDAKDMELARRMQEESLKKLAAIKAMERELGEHAQQTEERRLSARTGALRGLTKDEIIRVTQDVGIATSLLRLAEIQQGKHGNISLPERLDLAKRAFVVPPKLESAIAAQDAVVARGDPLEWSEDYFQFRILGQILEAPYTFAKIWEAVEQCMPETDYEDVKEKIFAYIADGTLRQRFDKKQKSLVFFPRRR